jgi:hypothetical protein
MTFMKELRKSGRNISHFSVMMGRHSGQHILKYEKYTTNLHYGTTNTLLTVREFMCFVWISGQT